MLNKGTALPAKTSSTASPGAKAPSITTSPPVKKPTPTDSSTSNSTSASASSPKPLVKPASRSSSSSGAGAPPPAARPDSSSGTTPKRPGSSSGGGGSGSGSGSGGHYKDYEPPLNLIQHGFRVAVYNPREPRKVPKSADGQALPRR